jgi:predicted glycoside hydrolase/deacetylase ChbG (UPF0249 family)
LRPAARSPREPNLAERLGYPADSRLLLLHADDLGLLHAVNAAAIDLFEAGVLQSGSVMVPCPWFPEFAAYARTRPALDIGVHLTFICESPNLRWGPILGATQVPSLVDSSGYFPAAWEPERVVNLVELEAEIRAQLDRAVAHGLEPTHLDAHAHTLQWRGRPAFEILQKVARDQRLPIRVGRNWYSVHPYLAQVLGRSGLALDRCLTIPPETAPAGWTSWYADTIRKLGPGVSELYLHPGYDGAEMRAYALPTQSWGPASRQRDFDAIQSRAVKEAIAAAGILPVTWREIRRLLPPTSD